MKRIGILGHGFIEWGGGLDFLRLTAESLVAVDPRLELHFLFPIAGPRYQTGVHLRGVKRMVKRCLGRDIAAPKAPDWTHLDDLVARSGGRSRAHRIDTGMAALRRAARTHQLDVLLPAIRPMHDQTVPWMGYLYDYQHAYHPEFFTPDEIAARDAHFAAMLSEARYVIVNAKAVEADIRRFNPEHRAKIVALPFSAAPDPAWLELGSADLGAHGIRGPYFIISNQFWQHKDHQTAWRALAMVLRQRPEVELVCTGEPHDYRNPGHVPGLSALAEELGISHRLRILGLIPKSEQIRLLRGAVAVLQPSLFEGGPGGGAVFDAVSLGVPAIVSDIAVNCELTESGVVFFKARDAAALADRMLQALADTAARSAPSSAELIAAGAERRRRCGVVLLDALRALVGEATPGA